MIERGPAIRECVLRAFNRVLEQSFEEVYDRVINDYGSVSDRTVYRHLGVLVKEGALVHEGGYGFGAYRLVQVATIIIDQVAPVQPRARRRKRKSADPQAAAKRKADNARRYAFRKENRLCIDCNAGLQEEDNLRCVECVARRTVSLALYSSTHRAERNRGTRERRKRNLERAKLVDRRAKKGRFKRGRCQNCKNDRLKGSVFCDPCRDRKRVVSLAYWRRKNGKPSVDEVPRLKDAEIARQLQAAPWEAQQ